MYVLIVWFSLGVSNGCGGPCAGVAMQEFTSQGTCQEASKQFNRRFQVACVKK